MHIVESKKCSNNLIRHIKFFQLKILKDYTINNVIFQTLIIVIKDIQELINKKVKIQIHIEVMKGNKVGIVNNIDKQ